MTVKLGVIMDPVGAINPKKDTTLTLLLAAQAMGWEIHYMEMPDLTLRDGRASAVMRPITPPAALPTNCRLKAPDTQGRKRAAAALAQARSHPHYRRP